MVPDRRGEAHLWLLLEEALVGVRRAGDEVREVRRNFRAVADALAATGLVATAVASALAAELDDALAVRGLLDPASFRARPFPHAAAWPRPDHAATGVAVWLEAEIERHLDLVAGFDPATRPDAGAAAMRILGGPVRAFEAAGALGPGRALMDDFGASLVSAGYEAGRTRAGADGRLRREWVRFLRERPDPMPEPHQADEVREPSAALGVVAGRTARVDRVAWSGAAVDVRVTLRAAAGPRFGDHRTPWHARALDSRGRLHLGPPSTSAAEGGSSAMFRLRPGLTRDADRLVVRITCGGERIEGTVPL